MNKILSRFLVCLLWAALGAVSICDAEAKLAITIKETVNIAALKNLDPFKTSSVATALSQAQRSDVEMFLKRFKKSKAVDLVFHLSPDGSKIDENTPIRVEIASDPTCLSEEHQLLPDKQSQTPKGVYHIEMVLTIHGKPFIEKVQALKAGTGGKTTISVQLYGVLTQAVQSGRFQIKDTTNIQIIGSMDVVVPSSGKS